MVGPSIREVKTAFKDFLEMAKDKKDEQIQQQPGSDKNYLITKNIPLPFFCEIIHVH